MFNSYVWRTQSGHHKDLSACFGTWTPQNPPAYRGYMDGEAGSMIYEKYAHMADGYDVIIGYIANDGMYQVLTDFFERRITDTALIGSLSALKLGRQYVAITQKACDQIKVIKERSLQKLDLMILKDRSVVRERKASHWLIVS